MIVVDSSFLIGFYNVRDAHHAKASSLMRDFLDGRWRKGLLQEIQQPAKNEIQLYRLRHRNRSAAAYGRLGAYLR